MVREAYHTMRGRCEALLPVRGAYCTLQVLFSTQPILLNVRYALRTASFVAHYPRTTRRYAPRGTRLSKMWYASRTICPALSQLHPTHRRTSSNPSAHFFQPVGELPPARRRTSANPSANFLLPFGTISPSGWRIFSIRVEDFLHQGGGFSPSGWRIFSNWVEDFLHQGGGFSPSGWRISSNLVEDFLQLVGAIVLTGWRILF